MADSDSASRREPRVGLRGGRYRSHSLAEKLAARTIHQPNGCWEVQGHALHSGHVQLSVGSPWHPPYIRVRAHVFAWEQAHGQKVPAAKVVRHLCHNPRCANPAHLEIGTQYDNIQDSVKAGRHGAHHRTGLRLNGQLSRVRRLSDDQQAELLAWLAADQPISAISRALHIGRKAIRKFRDRLALRAPRLQERA